MPAAIDEGGKLMATTTAYCRDDCSHCCPLRLERHIQAPAPRHRWDVNNRCPGYESPIVVAARSMFGRRFTRLSTRTGPPDTCNYKSYRDFPLHHTSTTLPPTHQLPGVLGRLLTEYTTEHLIHLCITRPLPTLPFANSQYRLSKWAASSGPRMKRRSSGYS